MIHDIQNKIRQLCHEKGICILAHCYQNQDIIEVADFTGDSFALAQHARETDCPTVIMCGVRFMAEGVKLLAPEKSVYLASPDAGCPMAEQFTGADVREYRKKHPDAAVVAYINTTAELKKECDVCVTSSSAVKIVKALPQQDILFIPDCNLGAYVAKRVPEKRFTFWQGGCPVHAAMTAQDVRAARELHPAAPLAVHPECPSEVVEAADYVGSTTDIMKFARESSAEEIIIGTEVSIVAHLKHECPDKRFYPLSKKLICADMKLTDISDVLACAEGRGGELIRLDEETMKKAVVSLDRMIELG